MRHEGPSGSGVVTLLTDFGTSDAYVGAMKGVLLSHAPHLTLVDITHEAPRYDVFTASEILPCYHTEYPSGSLHLCVVDPGVGSSREALLVLSRDYAFVAPDNGLLSTALTDEEDLQVFRIVPTWPVPSSTFHGRDIFAQAAGRFLAGKTTPPFLEPVPGYRKLPRPVPRLLSSEDEPARWEAHILRRDSFGNLISNLPSETHRGQLRTGQFRLQVGTVEITQAADHYDEAPQDTLFCTWGSAETLEISLREDSAAQRLRLSSFPTPFTITFRDP